MNDVYLDLGSELEEEIEKITDVNYEAQNGVVSIDSIIAMLKDLTCEYNDLKEELEDEVKHLKDENKNLSEENSRFKENIASLNESFKLIYAADYLKKKANKGKSKKKEDIE